MKCAECGASLRTEHRDHHYVESGLPNILLLGVEFRVCPSCGEEERVMPRLAQLHRVIAEAVAEKAAHLSGAEVRYLRKHLGWSGEQFAEVMGVRPETVSRWENDKEPIGGGYERALRLMAMRERPVESYPNDRLAEIAPSSTPMKLRLAAHKSGWRAEAVAA